jgi:hypothetical protein
MGLLTKEFETAPCVVEVSHQFDSLHAHVKFLNGAVINPGDEVQVQGPPVMAPYGEVVREERIARIARASKLEQLWTRWTGDFEFMELCEFSFSDDVDASLPGNEAARISQGRSRSMKDLQHSADASTVEEAMAAQNYEQAIVDSEGATALAMQNTLLTPRFYTTDFDEMDAINVEPVREDWDKLIATDEVGPQQGPFQEERGLGPYRLGRDGAEAEGGIHRLPRVVLHRRILGLRPLQGDEAARQQRGHRHAVPADGAGRGAACGLHQRRAARGGDRREPRLPDAEEEVHLLPAEVHLLRHVSSARRSATPATSRSSATSRRTPSIGSTRSSSGSRNGATTSSPTGRPSRC